MLIFAFTAESIKGGFAHLCPIGISPTSKIGPPWGLADPQNCRCDGGREEGVTRAQLQARREWRRRSPGNGAGW